MDDRVRNILVVLGMSVLLTYCGGCDGLLGTRDDVGDNATRGATLYAAKACAGCHGSKGCGDEGPNIQDTTFEDMDQFVRASNTAHLAGTTTGLSDQDIRDIVAFLNSQSGSDCAAKQLSVPDPPAKYADFSLIGVHDQTSDQYDTDCVQCHSERKSEGALDNSTTSAHSTMGTFLGTGNAQCLNCHTDGSDLVSHTTARLRNDMFSSPVAKCASAKCHGVSGPVPFYLVDK